MDNKEKMRIILPFIVLAICVPIIVDFFIFGNSFHSNKRWLGEAVINVLDNAIKYSPDGSKIFIRLQKRNDLVRMEIEDQGIGIPQNEYHKIFQRFYRGSSKEVMEKSGTGIGLFLSREIIEKHAGTITVTSGKKKKGSTFVIQLPYVG